MSLSKQAIVIRSDLDMSEGKKIAQACHACLGAFRKASSGQIETWEAEGQKKIVLSVDSEDGLINVYARATGSGLPAYMVEDAGRTELSPGTKTCVGIGPAPEKQIDEITGQLTLV